MFFWIMIATAVSVLALCLSMYLMQERKMENEK